MFHTPMSDRDRFQFIIKLRSYKTIVFFDVVACPKTQTFMFDRYLMFFASIYGAVAAVISFLARN
jgi:hypothetical protein